MAPITKMTPADFQEKQKQQRVPTDWTGPHPEQGQAPPGCGEAAAPAGEVQTDDRISPAGEEHHSGPTDKDTSSVRRGRDRLNGRPYAAG